MERDYIAELIEAMRCLSKIDGAVRYIHGNLKEDKYLYEQIDRIQQLLNLWYEEVK